MKKTCICFLCLYVALLTNAQEVCKTVKVKTPGKLSSCLTDEEKKTITNLTIKGTIEARDFKTIRHMQQLKHLNIKDVTINSYTEIKNIINIVYDSVYTQKSLPKEACRNMDSLQSVILPSTINVIGDGAFQDDNSLLSVTIPSTVITIGEAAFNYCKNLKSIDLPPNLINIGLGAFTLTDLASIFIPPTVSNIADYAFNVFHGLITVDSNNTTYSSINGMLFNKTQTILLQSSTSIKGEFIVPRTVTTIGIGAFWGCHDLTSLTFPPSLTEFDSYVIVEPYNLKTIHLQSTIPPKTFHSFYSSQISNIILNVPIGTKSAYQAADGWKDFKNIVEE
jgi:hypothetical protein